MAENKKKKKRRKHSNVLNAASYEIRKRWVIGSRCLIYSKSRGEWIQGEIARIYSDDTGEWLSVAYENRIKDVPRFDADVITPITTDNSTEVSYTYL